MRLTSSQENLLAEGVAKLAKRRIVFYNGSGNGVTQLVDHLRLRAQKGFKASHSENFTIDLIKDIRNFPRPDRTTCTGLQRLILDANNLNTWGNLVRIEREFSKYLLTMHEEGVIPFIAIDNAEKLNRAAYGVIKELNEYVITTPRGAAKRAGIAFVLGGDFLKCRMSIPFLEKCAEIPVEKMQFTSDIKDLIALVYPEKAHLFKPYVLEEMKRCSSVQQMIKSADNIVDWQEENGAKKEISERTAQQLVSRAIRILKLAA